MQSTEVWFRNPDLYIRECVELGVGNIAWDRGYLQKKSIDPVRFADLHYPSHIDYRLLLVGEQGTAELKRGRGIDCPVAVYPTFDYQTDTLAALESMLENPAGDDETMVNHASWPTDERPVPGQEHRVVIIRSPDFKTGIGRQFVRTLLELQEEHPEAIMHVHGFYSYKVAFGMGFGAADMDPRITAKKGRVTLGSGKEVTYEQAAKVPQWVTVLGYKPVDLQVPRNRCMFNMHSALWAAEHWRENFKFKSQGRHDVDPTEKSPALATTNGVVTKKTGTTVGDKFLCDTCSLQDSCKYFRTGEVCSIPGSEPSSLATLFKSRDPDTILEGLSTILAAQTRRAERAMEDEAEYGELDPEVTKILNGVFDGGVKLAKLRDPRRFSPGARLAVNIGSGNTSVTNATPQAVVASIVAELEGRGIPRDKITPELLATVLSPPDVIDVPALEEAGAGGSD